ncbi:MAG: enoyl-CoA hydratase-related protein [Flavobacteriaceae bacterium]
MTDRTPPADPAELQVDRPAEGVVRLRVNRPAKRNALSIGVRNLMVDELRRLDADETVRAVIIAGGEKVFASGADIEELAGISPVKMMLRGADRIWSAIAAFKKPLVAAVRGAAFGGGFELAMNCDIVVAASNAKFGLPEVRLGLIPGGGGTQRLIRLVGKHLAFDMLMTGRVIDGAEAMSHAIVSRCVDEEKVDDTAVAVASAIASMAPLAVRLVKDAALNGADSPLAAGIALERSSIQVLFDSEDYREGMAAFFEKRPPKFKGR